MKTVTLNLLLHFATLLLTVNGWANEHNPVGNSTNAAIDPKHFLELDGTAYADASPLLGGLAQATVMGWIKIDTGLSTNSFVMGQDNLNLHITTNGGNMTLVATAKNQSIAFPGITANRWYHVAVVYDNAAIEKLVLYINGKKEAASTDLALAGNLAASTTKFTMGKHPILAADYFKGGIDEVRVFNVALAQDILQKMVYQEIKPNGTKICGEVIPRDIEGTSWDTLLAYFKMDPQTDHILFNYANPTDGVVARTYNSVAFAPQQAPMPFVTVASGSLKTALDSNFVNAADASTYSWSILHVLHNIQLSSNQTTLGMVIAPDVTVTLNNDNKLQNSWYLKLDGKIDLRGKSQLVQTADSQLDAASTGSIERQQQGQSNRYNYNYWCAPVGSIGTGNNNPFTVDAILKDATDADFLQPITWTNSLDGETTTPITLSGFWIFKFQNMSPSYANWSAIGPFNELLPAQGFTLKGSSPVSGEQNLAFVGKPNNGTITTPIAPGHLNLTGNPYPSSLDVNAFLKDNHGKINGTLYFWEHDAANNTHILVDYQGGYATRNLVGGTPTFSLRGDATDWSHKTPGRFIPVGQGFFVKASSAGGNIVFSNSQRAFMKENATLSNPLYRQNIGPESTEIFDNENDDVAEDTFARIRIGFEAPNQFHRQVLLGFMDQYATSGVDLGYDAVNIDTQPYDMYLMNGNNKLVIAGEGYFNQSRIYPIGIKSAVASTVRFMLDGTENFEGQDIYIYDSVLQIYHNITNGAFDVDVPAGDTNNRFTLRFHNPLLNTHNFDASGDIGLTFTTNDNTIVLENNKPDTTAQTIALYNMLGQNIAEWHVANENQTKLQIPILQAHAGTYVVKVHTTSGDFSKKIIVR